ncbi:MFS transporter [Halorientalis pallida]|uniref:MFS transporter n=1 Tax=Halorientalis pallida TaxID=2479928 RepID=UPI003C70131B
MGTTETSEVGVPWRSPALVAILAATLMTPMDVPLISPALTEVQSVFGVSASRAGLFVTAYALPGILLAPVIGALADRLGRRYVLAGCLTVFGLAGTAIGLTTAFRTALALRVVQGFAAGSILSALAMTVVGDRYAGRQHDAVMGVTSAMLSLGTAAYPVVGGYLAEHAWNAPFLLYASTLPVAGLVLVAFDDGDTAREGRGGGYVREALRAVPTRRALALYGVMFLSFALLFGGIYTALPFYLAGAFGFAPTTVGLVTSAVLLVTALVSTQNGRLAARYATSTLLVVGFALYAVGFLGAALAGEPPLLIGALLVFGAGSGLVTPTLFAGISSLAPDHVRAGVMSLQTTTIGASQAAGPVVFTLLGAAVGYRTTILVASGGATVCMAALAVVAPDA